MSVYVDTCRKKARKYFAEAEASAVLAQLPDTPLDRLLEHLTDIHSATVNATEWLMRIDGYQDAIEEMKTP